MVHRVLGVLHGVLGVLHRVLGLGIQNGGQAVKVFLVKTAIVLTVEGVRFTLKVLKAEGSLNAHSAVDPSPFCPTPP